MVTDEDAAARLGLADRFVRTAAYTAAIVSAAAASAGYASDKLTRLHDRRAVNDTIDEALTELRALAKEVDITTGEPLPPDPGDDLVPGR